MRVLKARKFLYAAFLLLFLLSFAFAAFAENSAAVNSAKKFSLGSLIDNIKSIAGGGESNDNGELSEPQAPAAPQPEPAPQPMPQAPTQPMPQPQAPQYPQAPQPQYPQVPPQPMPQPQPQYPQAPQYPQLPQQMPQQNLQYLIQGLWATNYNGAVVMTQLQGNVFHDWVNGQMTSYGSFQVQGNVMYLIDYQGQQFYNIIQLDPTGQFLTMQYQNGLALTFQRMQ
ncbi:MAG: hypothetical protein IJ667_03445 [Synergistaceae bacterium]|nr:hypothetical protein [Synergistaceae bacterium]